VRPSLRGTVTSNVQVRERSNGAKVGDERTAPDSSAVIAVRYLPRRDAFELQFVSGGTVTVPTRAIPGLADAPIERVKQPTISAAGDAIVWRALDLDVDVAALVESVFGARLLAKAFGRRGGRRTSRAKAKAVRANGAKGGRPRNRSTGG
jgi:hypothetical protein